MLKMFKNKNTKQKIGLAIGLMLGIPILLFSKVNQDINAANDKRSGIEESTDENAHEDSKESESSLTDPIEIPDKINAEIIIKADKDEKQMAILEELKSKAEEKRILKAKKLKQQKKQKISDEKNSVKKNTCDTYTNSEINILCKLVEAEATSGNVQSKMNVASVVLNRVKSKEFPDTIEGVVFQRTGGHYQFSCIYDKRYYNLKVSDSTKKAVEKILKDGDTTKGALYFCNYADVKNNKTKKWFNRLKFILKDDIGHHFYK